MKQFEELGSSFSVRERVVTTVILLVWFFCWVFFSPPSKNTAECSCLWRSLFLSHRYRLLPLPLNFSWPSYSGRLSESQFGSLALYFKCQKGGVVNGNCDMDSCPSRAGLSWLSHFTQLLGRNWISVISNQKMKNGSGHIFPFASPNLG